MHGALWSQTLKQPLALAYEQEVIPVSFVALIEKEKQRAAMAWKLYQKHPTLEVKMMTQIHALANFGGRLSLLLTGTDSTCQRRVQWLVSKQKHHLALALLRAWLNQVYLKHLKALTPSQL